MPAKNCGTNAAVGSGYFGSTSRTCVAEVPEQAGGVLDRRDVHLVGADAERDRLGRPPDPQPAGLPLRGVDERAGLTGRATGRSAGVPRMTS